MKNLALLLFTLAPCHAAGLANGVKIGEVSDSSAVLWTRLTRDAEPGNRADEWKAGAPNWTVPGIEGKVRFNYYPIGDREKIKSTPWTGVDSDTDFCRQFKIEGLEPDTRYSFEAQGLVGGRDGAEIRGTFTTAPAPETEKPITFTVSTCQEFETRDDKANGHKIYRSMLDLNPSFFIQTGDTVYYDRKEPKSKNMDLARYRWGRMYALPFQKALHREIPSYWMHDDHDITKDDAWPGVGFGDLTWEQGLQIWREQIPQSDKPYRTFRWGKNLQIWLPEGREFRSPNTMEDGPEKSILGKEQWAWLEETMKASDATFKLYISATPVVGPDRDSKNDNHANKGYHYEGERLRKLLSSIPGCFVINGDRHWQYHSIDPETGLNEFGCGASSDAHAGGWNQKDKRPEHQFLRVKGGFASINVDGNKATFTHHDVDGQPVYTAEMER
ncbi:MAG: alkaline phosphatase D family protein [Akkermansiaceae bacterium]|nr:alkaline phosphatase D family protein [Akkermansiaceae bacterium]